MTRNQLDLLIKYINTKCAIVDHQGKTGGSVSSSWVDELVETLAELEESTEEKSAPGMLGDR